MGGQYVKKNSMNGPLHGSPFRANGSSMGRERNKNGVRTAQELAKLLTQYVQVTFKSLSK